MNIRSFQKEPSVVVAAVMAEGPVRDLLKAVQRDENLRDGVQAEWLKQLLCWVEDTVDQKAV